MGASELNCSAGLTAERLGPILMRQVG